MKEGGSVVVLFESGSLRCFAWLLEAPTQWADASSLSPTTLQLLGLVKRDNNKLILALAAHLPLNHDGA